MRLAIPAMLSVGLWGCGGGGGANHPDGMPDSPPDTAQSATLTLTTFRTSGPVNTQFVAVQDGDGPWAVVSGTSGVYTATLHTDRYGVMTGCTTTTSGNVSSSVFIHYGAVSDGLALYLADCADPGPAAATVSGTISGAAAANPVRVLDGKFNSVDIAAGLTTYSLPTVAGPGKLFAEELVGGRPVKVVMVDANVVDGALINFDLGAGFVPVTRALASSATLIAATLSYRDIQGISRLDRALSPVTSYRGIPVDRLGNGLNRLTASPNDGTTNASRTVIRYFKDPVDETITFSPMLQLTQQPVASNAPYPIVQFTLPIDADTTLYDVGFGTTNIAATASRFWSAEMTKAWVAKAFPGATSFPYTPPDFHALAGWRTDFQLEAGVTIGWNADRIKATLMDPFIGIPPTQFAFHDGTEEQIASAFGELAAP